MVDVMDVSTQKGTEMSMAQWTRYYETPPSQRERLFNVISLEFSHTKLEALVNRPATVDLIDWVDNMWPRHLKERQRESTNSINDMQYPKVQKYCLMSVQGCYTDFHFDFGGTSVWYHILRGSKVFWLIPPTHSNLEMYEDWVQSRKEGDIFLGDRASDCQRIELKQGCTFIIPSGWIHAVYTPVDSLVFGGNFLHSFNIPMQLNICNIEDRTRVPLKFRFPFFYEMCWYVLERYVFSLTKISYLTPEFQKHSLGIGLRRTSGTDSAEEQEQGSDMDDKAFGQQSDKLPSKVHLTPLELDGLWNLVGKLELLPSNKRSVPVGIQNASALLTHIKALLKEHANDNPKLSYTGNPIIKWPQRPSWYQPPSPPSPAPTPPPPPAASRPKIPSTPVNPRPQKTSSSMSVLRRRRVRCKRCEACVRPECGDCNFCRDMKKFGGPGKLKQTCVLRQCLSPGLPLSAVCEICKEPNQEGSGDPSLILMECSSCAQIAHPACLTIQSDGVVNKDLPSCWECPSCVQGITDRETKGEGSDSLTLKRKSSSLLDARIAKIYRRHLHSHDGDDSASDDDGSQRRKMGLSARGGGHSSRRAFGANRRGLLRGGLSHRAARGSLGTPGSAHRTKRGLGMREVGRRGRGVRLRGGSRMHRRGDESEESDDDDDDDDEDDDEDDDDEDDDDEEGDSEGDKERLHRRHWRRRTGYDDDDSDWQEFDPEEEEMDTIDDEDMKKEDEEEEGQWDSDPEPPVLLVSDLNDDLLSGSYLTVTLQHPHHAKTQSGSIVPKLEAAMGPWTGAAGGGQQGFIQRKAAHSKLSRHRTTDSTSDYLVPRGPGRPRVRVSQADKSNRNQSGSSEEDEAVPPSAASTLIPSLLSLPSFKDVGSERGGEKELWVSVFRYLSKADLLVCMTVCKAWYKWSCDKRLWSQIDVSRRSPLSNQALAGIVKRQPISLDLSWTPLARRQLNCLITRLPGLRELRVTGLPWSCLSALVSPTLPHLRLLDLRWCEGLNDAQLKEIITPPGLGSTRSRLRNMETLHLSGLDISESTLRLLQRHMPQLEKLDLAHCRNITDSSVALLTAPGTHTHNNLSELTLSGCSGLTESCLFYLKRLSCLTLLDLRGCSGISRRACDAFISDLSYSALYCMMEEKLIQRLD